MAPFAPLVPENLLQGKESAWGYTWHRGSIHVPDDNTPDTLLKSSPVSTQKKRPTCRPPRLHHPFRGAWRSSTTFRRKQESGRYAKTSSPAPCEDAEVVKKRPQALKTRPQVLHDDFSAKTAPAPNEAESSRRSSPPPPSEASLSARSSAAKAKSADRPCDIGAPGMQPLYKPLQAWQATAVPQERLSHNSDARLDSSQLPVSSKPDICRLAPSEKLSPRCQTARTKDRSSKRLATPRLDHATQVRMVQTIMSMSMRRNIATKRNPAFEHTMHDWTTSTPAYHSWGNQWILARRRGDEIPPLLVADCPRAVLDTERYVNELNVAASDVHAPAAQRMACPSWMQD